MWVPGEGGGTVAGEQVPELVVDHRAVREDQGGAAQQVAVDHRKAVAVRHRQCGCRPVGLTDTEVLGDGGGVACQVGVGQPDQLR